jgi:hypothetical protein
VERFWEWVRLLMANPRCGEEEAGGGALGEVPEEGVKMGEGMSGMYKA